VTILAMGFVGCIFPWGVVILMVGRGNASDGSAMHSLQAPPPAPRFRE
jgi:hypothetical protein